ncbi:MAG TPA: GNAT family N-acetyltransferase [Spirochaetia bacterium]|nr:GNAT family N-acetyltransferase [Spirochaetia bacterium]
MKPIRELRSEQELTECVALLRAAFATVAMEFGLTEKSAPSNAAFTTLDNLRAHLQHGMLMYGMSDGASMVGCVAIKQSKSDQLVFYIERLAVLPEHRHQGTGGQLLTFAMDTIRQCGGRTASIGVMDTNERLKEWYRSKGFAQHDCRRIPHLPFKVCFMSRELGGLPHTDS